jgi:hypothetical protein
LTPTTTPTPPLSDYKREDEIDSRNMLEMLEERRKRKQSDLRPANENAPR